MNRTEKAELIETLQETLSGATTVVIAHQVGLTVAESTELRQKMRESGSTFKVTKNRITKLALAGTNFEGLTDMFTGPTAMGTSADPSTCWQNCWCHRGTCRRPRTCDQSTCRPRLIPKIAVELRSEVKA